MSVEKFILGTPSALVSSVSLATTANSLGSAFDNTDGQTGNGYTLCDLEATITINSGTPAANTSITVWFLMTQNGSTYEDGSSSITPGRTPDVVFPLRASSSTQVVSRRVFMPWGVFKPLVKNDSAVSVTVTISIRPVSHQLV